MEARTVWEEKPGAAADIVQSSCQGLSACPPQEGAGTALQPGEELGQELPFSLGQDADALPQWLSAAGILPPDKRLPMSGDIFSCFNEGWRVLLATGIQWVEARDAATHPAVLRTDA